MILLQLYLSIAQQHGLKQAIAITKGPVAVADRCLGNIKELAINIDIIQNVYRCFVKLRDKSINIRAFAMPMMCNLYFCTNSESNEV